MIDRLKAVEIAAKIQGWMKPEELGWLYDQASDLNPEDVWCEVGTWKGRSAFAVAMGLPDHAGLICVDPHKDSVELPHAELNFPMDWVTRNFEMMRDYARELRPKVQITFLREESLKSAKHKLDESLSVVFIDGAHDYDSVVADIKAWEPKVKVGGLICGHDYSNKEVRRAVELMLHPVARGAGSIWWTRV